MIFSILRMTRAQLTSRATLAALGLASLSAASSFSSSARCDAAKDDAKVALSSREFRTFTVRKVDSVTHNTKRIVFDLPSEDHEMGITTASCLLAKAKVDGKNIVRPYTPTNINSEKGFLELVVKGYQTGLLSKHIVELKEGDVLEMKGPFVKFAYKPNEYKKIGMIAGGSGLTPMLQVAKEICRNPADKTEIVLIFANVTEEDIILREELDALQYLYPQFKVIHVLSNPAETWTGLKGFVSKEMIEEFIPGPSDDHLVCVCGPPPMMYHISGDKAKDKTQGELQGLLKDLNYTSKQVFKF
uniref:NADH-cytochrome b5 reductase n=1 Tax=Globisporangium ultimum (strain ATCC 200006 / CBS 805.95 / DAOM BR144) TaxID=431595 RepID=K3WYP0_GLOUD